MNLLELIKPHYVDKPIGMGKILDVYVNPAGTYCVVVSDDACVFEKLETRNRLLRLLEQMHTYFRVGVGWVYESDWKKDCGHQEENPFMLQ